MTSDQRISGSGGDIKLSNSGGDGSYAYLTTSPQPQPWGKQGRFDAQLSVLGSMPAFCLVGLATIPS